MGPGSREGGEWFAHQVIDLYRSRLGVDAPPIDVLEAVGTDLIFRMPSVELAEAQGRHAAAYSYLFTHRSTSFGGLLGAAHTVEIPFVFDTLDADGTSVMLGDVDEARRSLARRMTDCWASFA